MYSSTHNERGVPTIIIYLLRKHFNVVSTYMSKTRHSHFGNSTTSRFVYNGRMIGANATFSNIMVAAHPFLREGKIDKTLR